MIGTQTNNFKKRSPIVVVMGHVDHGKTTLLDYIRKSKVAEKEAGGITQSIGAYVIEHRTPNNEQVRQITFIDTPGHEAFSKMRSRGATVADLAILVIAAEEGVKPQTAEAIKILNETKTPFIVAVTKIDKPGANVEKIKNDLMSAGVLLEGYGGQISYQPVSAKTGDGINELLELILLAADMENLAYDPAAVASGFVLETRMDPRRGGETTVIVKNGTLRQGDPIVAGEAQGKIKILENFLGKSTKELEPSAPALVFGFETLPQVGEEFFSGNIPEEKDSLHPTLRESALPAKKNGPSTAPVVVGKQQTLLRLILKSGDAGSLEALSEVIQSSMHGKPLQILDESVGEIGENDVKMAVGSEAIIVGFKSDINKTAKTIAENHRVRIITSKIIYELLQAIEKLLIEIEHPAPLGELEILAVFNQKKLDKQVVGGKVISGIFKNRAQFQVKRGEEIVGQGRTTNLQQNKKDMATVTEGNEAGLMVNCGIALAAGDRLVIGQ